MSEKKLIVKCPTCKKEFNYYKSEVRPFCREKCKMVDLGHWLTETYSTPAVNPPDEDQVQRDLDELRREGDS